MAFIELSCHSNTLGMAIQVNVLIPQPTGPNQVGIEGGVFSKAYPVLYLLHGLSDDHSIWARRTAIERYVAEYNIAVVMPNVHRSYYCDMSAGLNYWTFVSEELPELMQHFFPISNKREDTFVAGLSMGGFGAFKLAMNCPDKFAAAASLSGALNPRFMLSWDEHRQKEFGWMFGDAKELEGSMNDLKHVLKSQVEANVQLPKLWMHCGTEDFLYEDNIQFRDFVNDLDIDFSYHEGPGQHEWGIWDEQIQHVLRWLPIKA